MGSSCEICDGSQRLKIANINYSGLSRSPFQFYLQEEYIIQKNLERIYEQQMNKQFPQYKKSQFKWQTGKIDKVIKQQRYSPLYNKTVGVIDIQKVEQLITDYNTFARVWQQKWSTLANKFGNIDKFHFQQSQIDRMLSFDWICYKVIIRYVYKVDQIKKIPSKSVRQYLEFMEKWFKKKFIDERFKQQKLYKAMLSLDILFIQQSTPNLIKFFENNYRQLFKVCYNQQKSCAIIVKRDKITEIDKKQQNQIGKIQNYFQNGEGTIVTTVLNSILIISAHLPTRKNINQFETFIQKVQNKFANIIAGITSKQFIQQFSSINIYPSSVGQRTTLKMRTIMQPQTSKSDQLSFGSKSFLMSKREILNQGIKVIDGGTWMDVGYLPCDRHPFDHFLVVGQLLIESNQMIK